MDTATPFTSFRFKVLLEIDGRQGPLCKASFSECDGLEITMQPKTIREGGNNNQPIHLIGSVSYGQLSLKRGMTDTLDLWNWFEQVLQTGQNGLRADAQVIMLSSEGTEKIRFNLKRCLPVKIKAPAFNAKDGILAIEEMQIAYELLDIQTI